MMCLRDPADITNDVGRKGIAIKHVQMTLRDLQRQMKVDLMKNERPSLIKPLVGEVYMLNHARRSMLENHGQQVLARANTRLAHLAKQIREKDATKPHTAPGDAKSSGVIVGVEEPVDAEKAAARSGATTSSPPVTTPAPKTQGEHGDASTW